MFQYIRQKVEIPDKIPPSALLGYSTFWKLPKGEVDPNGFSIPDNRAFAVKTYPSLSAVPFDTKFTSSNLIARVISHEIGHILGLDHYCEPDSRREELMFSGTRGTRLMSDQITIARGVAAAL